MSDTGKISDGYHTFDELYEHRSVIFLALMKSNPQLSWYSLVHEDGTMFDGMFIVGINLPTGQITYHLEKDPWWPVVELTHASFSSRAPRYDGHTSEDVIERILDWIRTV